MAQATEFSLGPLRRSVNVGLEGRFADYAGDVIAPDQAVVLAAENAAAATEAKIRLARIGFDRVIGALSSPIVQFLAHRERVDPSARITATEPATRRSELARLQLKPVYAGSTGAR